MDLNHVFLKTVLTLYDEMFRNGVSLVYLGEFSHQITKMFSSMAEQDVVVKSNTRKTQKRVYHVIVETLQNMNKHSDEISQNKNVGNGLFIVGNKDDIYYIITLNKVSINKREVLKAAIDQVNNASKEELKAMHKKQIKEGELSDKGGAGLGLIDIARKTESPLQFQFVPFDKEYCFFMLKVEINIQD